ncbi:unnamed protein product [Durusdinium trenchii]|uniref:C3H1-type domain-containing protein n=1 Tax=Durusdinium trenchii TaxID=1381693 RepID=A0ABP0JWM5_9DINO
MAQITNLPMTSTNAPAPLSPKAEGYANDYTAEPMKIVSSLETSPGSKLRATAPVFLPKQFQVECEKKLYTEEDDLASPTSKDPGSPSSVMSRTGTRVHFPPGLEPPDDTPSHGSSLHASGLCKPCAWFWKAGSCQNGKECLHCHLCPKDELKSRKKAKSTIMRLGLTTPKPTAGEERVSLALSQFCFTEQQVEVETSEQGSTAAATESDNTTPRQTQAKPLSAGSVLHGTGECRPCAWFWKPNGCLNGVDCRHCHDCPPGEVKSRKKGKQAMLRLGLATPKAGSEAHFEALH